VTATNHAATGALIAMAVKQPWLAIPFAFLSHFILDAIPHFGIHEDDVIKRNGHWLFRTVVAADVLLAVTLFIALPIAGRHTVAWGLILACMTSAFLPDATWIYRYFGEIRTKLARPHGWYDWFHQKIQWSEKPWGLIIEIVWFSAIIGTTMKLI
jgi:hypothetical protein